MPQATAIGPRLRTEVVDVTKLRPAEHTALADELFAVHKQVFGGLSRREFVAYVLHDGSACTRIKIFRAAGGQAVGYCATHRYFRTFDGKPSTIFRAEAGLLPEHRGQTSTWSFGFAQSIRYKFLHPTRQAYYLGMLVHPSSYCILAERFSEIYPSCRRNSSPELLKAMAELADSFGVPAVDGTRLVRSVGWVTKQTPAEAGIWASSDDPDVRFFLDANPGYYLGHGLVTVVPLTFRNLFCAGISHFALTARHAVARLISGRKRR